MQNKISKMIKGTAIAVLFILGFAEMFFPFDVSMLFYSYRPQFWNTFDVSKFSDQQRQLYEKFHLAMYSKCQTVFYFGIVTIIIAVLLLWADRPRKTVS